MIAQKGFHGASLDEIADAAGFTKGAIYSNFDSKEGLLLAVVEEHSRQLFSAYERFMGRPGETPPVDVPEVVRIWAEAGDRDQELNLLSQELRLLALRNPEMRMRLASHLRASFEQVVDVGLDRDLAVIALAASWSLWEYRAFDHQHADEYESAMRRFIELLTREVDVTLIDAPTPAPPT